MFICLCRVSFVKFSTDSSFKLPTLSTSSFIQAPPNITCKYRYMRSNITRKKKTLKDEQRKATPFKATNTHEHVNNMCVIKLKMQNIQPCNLFNIFGLNLLPLKQVPVRHLMPFNLCKNRHIQKQANSKFMLSCWKMIFCQI